MAFRDHSLQSAVMTAQDGLSSGPVLKYRVGGQKNDHEYGPVDIKCCGILQLVS